MKTTTKKHAKHRNGHQTLTTTLQEILLRVALYYRVSTDDQADRGTIEAQRDFLRQYVQLYGLQVADEYTDDGISGRLLLSDRPEGRRLLQDAEAGRFDCVLVYRLTRLGRSLKALINAHDTLSGFGVTIRSATEPFDTSTPIGTFLFQLRSSLAELDRAQMLEQMGRGRDRVARNGAWPGGLVPYGYVYGSVDENGEKHEGIIPSTELVEVLGMTEAEVVRDLFLRIAAGSSSVAEAARLNALGVPLTRRYTNGRVRTYGSGTWHPNSIAAMIHHTVYCGVHTLHSRFGAIERDVPPLVDADLWERANAQIQRNRNLPKSNATRQYLLSGLITCGQCKRHYTGQVITTRNRAYYRCGSHKNPLYDPEATRCRGRVVDTDWLEGIVWEDCRAFMKNPEQTLAEAQRQLQARQAQVSDREPARSSILAAVAAKAQERDSILTLFRRGRVKLDDAEWHLDVIAQEEATLRQQLSALEAQQALAEASAAHLTEAHLLLQRLHDRLDDIERTDDRDLKRQIVERLVQEMRVDTAPDRQVTVAITYVFGPERVANVVTPGALSGYNTLNIGAAYESMMRWVGRGNRVIAMAKVHVPYRRNARGALTSVRIPDHVDILYELANGAQVHMRMSATTGLSTGNQIWLYGTEGTIHVDQQQNIFAGRRGDKQLSEVPNPPQEQAYYRVEEEFTNAIRGTEEITMVPFETGVHYMEWTEAVIRSAQTGQAIYFPL